MKVKEVIKVVANLLQLGNVLDADLDNATNLNSQTQKDINLIVSCINMVLCDVATDFLPLKAQENIVVSGGEFDLKNLNHDFHKLLSVETIEKFFVENEMLKIKDGSYVINYSYLPKIVRVDFSALNAANDGENGSGGTNSTEIISDDGEGDGTIGDNYSTGGSNLVYEIDDNGEGSYIDSNVIGVGLNNTIEDVDPRLTIFALSFGVASEFCLVSGNYSESEMWNSKYQNAMNVCMRKMKISELKTRRWIWEKQSIQKQPQLSLT